MLQVFIVRVTRQYQYDATKYVDTAAVCYERADAAAIRDQLYEQPETVSVELETHCVQ
jgi:hypothetical protein